MNVVVTVEQRFDRLPDGSIWTPGNDAYAFWTRYLDVFDGVKVIARLRDVVDVQPGYSRADGPKVAFVALPHYLGPLQYLKKARKVKRALQSAVTTDDAVIMRVPSHIAGCLEPILAKESRPYGLKVVGDPFDVYAPRAVRHWGRGFFRWWFTRQLRRQCQMAAVVSYVTRRYLQEHYPSPNISIGVSDVEISDDAIADTPDVFTGRFMRRLPVASQPFRLITVGSLAQMYKAPDVLIRAVAECVKAGLDLSLDIVGDGKYRSELERLASGLGLGERIRFLGHLPAGPRVRAELDQADLFILASRCEGLPRAMIEAMARALPCIGSTVGGMPELLPIEDLVSPSSVSDLAAKIRQVLSSPARMCEMSVRNLAVARQYSNDCLDEQRRDFLVQLRRVTAQWHAASHRGAADVSYATSSFRSWNS